MSLGKVISDVVPRVKSRLVAVREKTEQYWRPEARDNRIKSAQQGQTGAVGFRKDFCKESIGPSDQAISSRTEKKNEIR